MATCKDCIHHKVCSADRKNDKYFMLIGCVNVETNCIDFVGKSNFVEVVHGRCEYCKDGKSFIGARLILGNDGEWHEINHCPNCGAKMDGDGNG